MKRIVLAVVLAACLVAGLSAPSWAQPVWTRVTYISGASVYIEAGTVLGVHEGTRLDVVRGGEVIAELVAQFVSSSRASCAVEHAASAPAIGDSVRFAPPERPAAIASTADSAQAAATAASTSARRPAGSGAGRIRGRIGLRYLMIDQGNGAAGTMSQPGVDVRLEGRQIGGSPLGIAVDVRTQQSVYAVQPGDSARPPVATLSRVYQAMLTWNPPGSHTQVSVGRQLPVALSTIGMFDGTAIDVDHDRWSVGALAGTDPDPVSLGLSQTTRRYGAYLQFHSVPARVPLWSLTFGGVGAYDRGQIDREFAYFRATFTSPRFSLFAAQELDVNRGWKAALEGSSTTPTSTFVLAQVTIADGFTINGGADNRRNVRLYRDYENPEIAFDDAFRQGTWGGASLALFGHLRLSSDVRRSSGGTAGDAQSLTNAASLMRISALQLALHARQTTFTGSTGSGSLESASLEINPFGVARLEWTTGRRESLRPGDSAPTQLTWTGLDADISIGRSLYLMLSASREQGASERTLQSFATINYRF